MRRSAAPSLQWWGLREAARAQGQGDRGGGSGRLWLDWALRRGGGAGAPAVADSGNWRGGGTFCPGKEHRGPRGSEEEI